LVDNKIHSVPIFDPDSKKYVAFVDLIDLAVHLGRTYIENEIIEGSVSRMLQEEKHYTTIQIADESKRNPWYTVDLNSPLKDAIELMIKYGVHRVAVSDSQGNLVYVLTQTDLISLLYKHLNSSGLSKLASQTIEEINLGFKEVISVSLHEKVWKSFIFMNSKALSGIGVTDDNGQLIGHLSSADLKGVDFDTHIMEKLKQTVQEFKKELKTVSVKPTATFGEVITVLEQTKSAPTLHNVTRGQNSSWCY